ncbi:response regulator [Blautia sp. HCP3S3_H10_1]|uniref:response regulator n=1 Tax=unclassified Blautia TaxID=2648079 RepID=UPI003F92046C|nr:response regulator [Clostridia bacterium]
MKIIYVDDEKIQLENFRLTTMGMEEISSLELFSNSLSAYEWAREHQVDVAFLDIEMPYLNGIGLAKKLKEINRKTIIVFVTAYDNYAFDAFEVRPAGYLLKPYNRKEIENELENISFLMNENREKKISIITMPDLSLKISGKDVFLGHGKPEELFALLVDRGENGVTKSDAVACLWEGKILSSSTYGTCLYRLKNILEEAGAPDLLLAKGNTRYLNTSLVDCDLYRMLNGDKETIAAYSGMYLRRYSWAEERTAQLNEIKKKM